MNTLTEDFDIFVKKITLNKTKVDDIIAKHNELTDMIKNDVPDGYEIIKTRLSGSYAKNTVINEYDPNKKPDVDIIVLISKTSKSVEEINKDFLSYFVDKKGKIVSDIRQQSNSIGLIYSNISADIVIAEYIDETNEIIEITSHKKEKWIESNSLRHVNYMCEKNKKYEGFSYYSLMKLFKYINKEILINPVKSFTLEQLVHHCVPNPSVGLRIYQAFAYTLENISKLTSITEIKDCCDASKDAYDDKDIINFPSFLNEICIISSYAQEALDGNRKNWERIFGDRFPEQPEQKIELGVKYDKSQTPWCC